MKYWLQNLGKALILPISLLSAMALLLGLTAAFTNNAVINVLPFLEADGFQLICDFLKKLAAIPFAYLPLLFAMAIPLAMCTKDKEVATYSGAIGYITLLVSMQFILGLQGFTAETTSVSALIEQGYTEIEAIGFSAIFKNVMGLFVYNMSILGGIIAGIAVVLIHNRFRQTELPSALSFYSGKKFVPIMTVFIMALVAVVITFVWPFIDHAIISLGGFIGGLGFVGVGAYGFFERILVPTGLHHILNELFRFTSLGGTATIDGEIYVGALNIYYAELYGSSSSFTAEATQWLSQGKINMMVFGLPAAALAMYHTAKQEVRPLLKKLLIPGVAACMLTGITEPIEFLFIFISPLLWLVHAIFAGFSFFIPAILGATIGNIQGGVLDWLIFGVLQGLETKWYLYLITGPLFAAAYYFSFKFLILKYNIMTPGRGDNMLVGAIEEADNSKEVSIEQLGIDVAEGLGGVDNILVVDNCISRLRVDVKDDSKVDEVILRKTEYLGLNKTGNNHVHVIYGGRVTKVRNALDNYMEATK